MSRLDEPTASPSSAPAVGPDTNESQFYITLAPCPHLSGSHVRFGRLVSGDAALAAAEVGSRAGARGWRRTARARHNRCLRPLAAAARRRAAARRGRGGSFAERGWGSGGEGGGEGGPRRSEPLCPDRATVRGTFLVGGR